MIRSAPGSSRSSAKIRNASGIGTRVCIRLTSAASGSLSDGAATRSDAGIACSRPTAPAMVSRSDSVQTASPSSLASARRSLAAPLSPCQL